MDQFPVLTPAQIRLDPPPLAHLLIVDDEPRIGSLYRRLLAAPARTIDVCSRGREAIDWLQGHQPDLILLDLKLPDIGGLEIMEWLHARRSDTPVVVFSGDDRIDVAIAAQRLGSQGFLRKHADPAEVLDLVDRVLKRRHREREHAAATLRLDHSERLHRFLVEHSPDIIYTLDEAGRFAFINGRIEAMLGYRADELIGQHYSELVHEDDRDQVRYAFAERRSGARATFNHELRLRCRNDEVRNFENRMVVALLCSTGLYRSGAAQAPADFVGTAGVLRDITERKRAEESITFQAFHDLLTGLPNRGLFRDRLDLAISQARRSGQRIGLLYLDLDRFKQINDTWGHAEGDQLLRGFADRVRNCLRAGDTLARQGGDEFTVLLPDLAGREAALATADKILSALAHPFVVAGEALPVSASIGVAVFPDDGECAETLMKNADSAMYRIKTHGRNGAAKYSTGMAAPESVRSGLENELRAALAGRQLEMHYQPLVDVGRQRIVGAEALLRWRHPTRGLVGPNDFIPLAEACGLIFDIGDQVLDAACGTLAGWSDPAQREWILAINVSPLEFERHDFVDRILQALARHGAEPRRLDIEITENLLMADAERVIECVATLRRHGLRVSIDDFGTRYSSLNYLRRLHVNCVKIDQCFVRDIASATAAAPVVEAIAGIARGFELEVLAEGVETAAQMQCLQRFGCAAMQGFHFARAMPLADFAALAADREWLTARCAALPAS